MSNLGEMRVAWMDTQSSNFRSILTNITEEQRKGLCHILSLLSVPDTQKLVGALEIEQITAVADILSLISDLDHYELYPDVSSERELGVYLVESGAMQFPESALPYLDYNRIGVEFRANHSGSYINSGYVVRTDEGPRQEPDRKCLPIFKLHLYAPEGTPAMTSPYCLELPASPERLKKAKLLIGVTDFAQTHIVQAECPITTLQHCIDQNHPSVELLGEIAMEIERIRTGDSQLTDLCAILEAESPETVEQAAEIIQCYDDYEVMRRDVSSPSDYGEFVLYQSKSPADDFDFKEEVRDFIDYEAYGKYKMEENGVRQTNFGLVRRLYDPFSTTGFEMNMQ